jgi:hypothetical protein
MSDIKCWCLTKCPKSRKLYSNFTRPEFYVKSTVLLTLFYVKFTNVSKFY